MKEIKDILSKVGLTEKQLHKGLKYGGVVFAVYLIIQAVSYWLKNKEEKEGGENE